MQFTFGLGLAKGDSPQRSHFCSHKGATALKNCSKCSNGNVIHFFFLSRSLIRVVTVKNHKSGTNYFCLTNDDKTPYDPKNDHDINVESR